VKNLRSPKTVKWIVFADCGEDDSPPAESQHQVLLVSSGSALRFSLFWGLLSVFVTPALLLLGFVTMIRIWLSSERSNKISLFGWNALALSAGVIAEVNFMAARK
jgi:hypothetical protein